MPYIVFNENNTHILKVDDSELWLMHLLLNYVKKSSYLFVKLQIFHWGLLTFLCYLSKHVVNKPLFFIAVPLTTGSTLETLECSLQHGVSPFLHLHE